MTGEATVSFSPPLYVVAAPLGPESDDFQPIIVDESPIGTFDDELLPALVGIWYAMHLPKNRFEMLDMPLIGVQDRVNGVPRSHSIVLIPDTLLDDLDLMR